MWVCVSRHLQHSNIIARAQFTAAYFCVIRQLHVHPVSFWKGTWDVTQSRCYSSVLEFVFSGTRSGLPSESRIGHQKLLGHRSITFISWPLLIQRLPEAMVTKKTLVKIALVVFCSVNIPQERKILNWTNEKKILHVLFVSQWQILDYKLQKYCKYWKQSALLIL